MAESSSKADEKSASAVLPLQEWLKLLAGRGVDMRVAIALAAKIYSSHGSKERLGGLTAQKLTPIIPDKDQRKSVLNAVKGIASGQTYVKKRTRDSDLLEPLAAAKAEQAASLEFHEITDPEALIPVTITTNRAPVKTAWAYTVALRMGFDVQEALSIAHVYVHLSSLKHALMLGNILNAAETKDAEDELSELPGETPVPKLANGKGKARGRGRDEVVEIAVGSSQPWVGIMRARIPVIERPDGTWRAIQKGLPVEPSVAYLYITRAFRDYTGHVMGSLKLLADSYTGDELNRLGLHMYNAFKPDVVTWGQKGFLECAKILDQMKDAVPDEAAKMAAEENGNGHRHDNANDKHVGVHLQQALSDELPDPMSTSPLSEPPPPEDEPGPPAKKQKTMTVDEYEALLDADGEGGFLEARDIHGAQQQGA